MKLTIVFAACIAAVVAAPSDPTESATTAPSTAEQITSAPSTPEETTSAPATTALDDLATIVALRELLGSDHNPFQFLYPNNYQAYPYWYPNGAYPYWYPNGAYPYPNGAYPYPNGAYPYPNGAYPYPSGANPYPSGANPYANGAKPHRYRFRYPSESFYRRGRDYEFPPYY